MRPDPEAAPAETSAEPFTEPWHAQLHALTVALHEAGAFAWPEWADALSRELHRPEAARDGSDHWHGWLDALTGLLDAKGLAGADAVRDTARAWRRAAEATPHGAPITLANDPERGAS